MHLTPDILEGIYVLLCRTPPFKGWKMPHVDDVEFHAVRIKWQGDHCKERGRHKIRIAVNKHHTLHAATMTMAHEMVHMHLEKAYPRDKAHHGSRFNRHADIVCRKHGFDRGQF